MRLKTFNAKTMKEVMTQVREEMGPDAIIVSIDQSTKIRGIRVTAAVEGTIHKPDNGPANNITLKTLHNDEDPRPFDLAELTAVFSYHGLPFDLASRLQDAVTANVAESLNEALALGLEMVIRLSPLSVPQVAPIMLIGPPGAGKTVSCAKLAAEAMLNGHSVRLITCDTVKTGGVQQLRHLAEKMQLGVEVAKDEKALKRLMSKDIEADITIIDTAGTNPFEVEELQSLAHLVKTADAEPVVVMTAGLDPQEAGDIAEIFASMGAKRLLVTRLDAARRFASLLTAVRGGRLSLAALGQSPYVADGLQSPTYMTLARMLTHFPRPALAGAPAQQVAQ